MSAPSKKQLHLKVQLSSSCASRAIHPASSGANIQPVPSTAIRKAEINATGPKAVIATFMAQSIRCSR
jgi:hypothetical protein